MAAPTRQRRTNPHLHSPTQHAAKSGVKTSDFDRKRVEATLEQQLQFERLLSEISADFVGGDLERINESISVVLGRISDMLGSDLTTFLQLNQQTGALQHTHQ